MSIGASLSPKACKPYDIDPAKVLVEAIDDLEIKRFRLMSYWDDYEQKQGKYDFNQLDELIDICEESGAKVSLCLGMRQPRWPECHIPKWAAELTKSDRDEALLTFIEVVVNRYKDRHHIVSWQLENEAFNRGIGTCTDYDRNRLRREYSLVKELDPERPIIMSTSNSWGLPILGPIPDIFGFSYYLHQWGERGLSKSFRPIWFQKLRARFVKIVWRRPVFCHELQMEPWGPKGNEKLSEDLQDSLMSAEQLKVQMAYAKAIGLSPVDLWGIEWLYWRQTKKGDMARWDTVKKLIT